jgi:hypothetical protein
VIEVGKGAAKRSIDLAMIPAQLFTAYGKDHCMRLLFVELKTRDTVYHRETPSGRGQLKAAKLRRRGSQAYARTPALSENNKKTMCCAVLSL